MVAPVKREHHDHWTAQNRRLSQRLGRRIKFPPVYFQQSNLRLFKFLARLGLQTSSLGQCDAASSTAPKESPRTVFAAITLQNFSYEQVCSFHTIRVQVQWQQRHQTYPVSLHSCIPSYVCYRQHFLTPTSDYDHVLCAGVQTLRCVPLCTATYSTDALLDSVSGWWMQTLKQSNGFRELVSVIFWSVCIIIWSCAFWIWMLHMLYALLLSHINPQVHKYITSTTKSSWH